MQGTRTSSPPAMWSPRTRGMNTLYVFLMVLIAVVLGYLEFVQSRQILAVQQMSAYRNHHNTRSACWDAAQAPNSSARLPPACFTVFVNTFKRTTTATAAAQHYRACPRVGEVRLVWVESKEVPPGMQKQLDQETYGAPVTVDSHFPTTDLNTRFKAIREVRTPAVFSVDDDVRVSCQDLHGAHDAWLGAPDRIVGFFPRMIQPSSGSRREWLYRAYPTVAYHQKYSIVLTKAAFVSTADMKLYGGAGAQLVQTRKLVEKHRNCEDIAFQFVSSRRSGAPPLYYSPRDSVVDYGSWMFGMYLSGISSKNAGKHMLARNQCVTRLASIWGNETQALPVASDVAGTGRWHPATGWEVISSDLLAPFLAQLVPVLLICVCALIWYHLDCSTLRLLPTSPSLILANMGRCGVLAVVVSVLLLFVVVRHPAEARRPLTSYLQTPCSVDEAALAAASTGEPRRVQRKLRIAVTSGVYAGVVDGVSLTMNRMVRHLSDQGHDVLVFAPDHATERGIKKLQGRVVKTAGLSGYLLGKEDYYYSNSLGAPAVQALEAFNPDVIHSATPDGGAAEAQRWAARRGIPQVCSYHTRFNTYFSYYNINFLETPYWLSVAPFFNGCARVLPPTDTVRDELVGNGVTSKVSLWGRGVDTRVFHPGRRCQEWLQAEKTGPVVLFASRLVREKNLRMYVEVIRALEAAGTRHTAVVVGDGQARAEMEALIPNALFLGRADEQQLGHVYASSDVFLFPSLTETWGNVVLEAMASGLPVVGANASGTSFLIEDGKTGYLCAPTNTSEYVARVTEVITQPLLRAKMGDASRRAAEARTWDRAFGDLLDTYYEAIDEKGERRAR